MRDVGVGYDRTTTLFTVESLSKVTTYNPHTGKCARAAAPGHEKGMDYLWLGDNMFGDEGLAALVAPPPPRQVRRCRRKWE